MTHTRTNQPMWRKTVYGIVGVALTVLTALGVIDAADGQALQASIGELMASLVTLIGAVSSFLAMVKTHFGSDDPTTAEDVERARQEGIEEGRNQAPDYVGGTNLTPPRPGANLPVYQRPAEG